MSNKISKNASRFSEKEFSMKTIILLVLAFGLGGCGAISATSVRCGTDGDASYVELVSAPQQVGNSTRAIAEMCAFAYEGE
jgi:hypothetical protein